MSFFSWLGNRRTASRCLKARSKPRLTCRLHVERLEDRAVPANYSAATVPVLIAAMDAANLTAEADTIALVAASTYTLTEVNNTVDGANGLPVIAANEDLTILGNGSIIQRSAAVGTPAFRLLDVSIGASLTLENLTLQGGLALGSGGTIVSHGSLTMRGVTVQNNLATLSGGGIQSNGALTLESSVIQNNKAIGLRGVDAYYSRSGPVDATNGTSAFGGGLFVGGGTALLTGVTFSANTAQGGDGGNGFRGANGGSGGSGYGGGLYVAGGAVTLRDTVVTGNTAKGGAAGKLGDKAGQGVGGGLYIEDDALLWLDAFTQSQVKRNKATTSDPNIHGSYTLGD